MKSLLTVIILLSFILASGTPVVAGELKSATIEVEGMTCSLCAPMVEKTLSSTKGVKKVHVDFDKKEAHVEYDDGVVKPEELIKAIDKGGFKASIKKERQPHLK
jgi:copper chaperone CopZ